MDNNDNIEISKRKNARWPKIILAALVLLFISALLVIKFAPYQSFVEQQIKHKIEAHGFKVTSLKMEKLTDSETIISDIGLEGAASISISKININYSLLKLITSKFFANVDIKMNVEEINISFKDYKARMSALNLNANKTKGNWVADITIPSLQTAGLPQEVPPIAIDVNITTKGDVLNVNMKAHDEKNEYIKDVELSSEIDELKNAVANVKRVQVPWGGGKIHSENIKFPLAMDKPIEANIALENVQLTTLLGKLSDGKINGEGSITGVFPVIYYPDGKLTLKDGSAESGNKGTISVAPELIPGDNAQIEFARDTLKNFHYTTLKILVSSDKEDKSAIDLLIEGKNPNSEDSRPVKLNVNLAGDIIPLLQQSILPLNDFRELLHQKDTK